MLNRTTASKNFRYCSMSEIYDATEFFEAVVLFSKFYSWSYIYVYIHRRVVRPVKNSSVWLGLTSRDQLMSLECLKHEVLSLAKMLVVNKQSNLFSSVFSRVLNE